jgi:hypothetical protein
MAKKIISLAFTYARAAKNFHVYELADEHEFFPKKIYLSKKDAENPVKRVIMNLTLEV